VRTTKPDERARAVSGTQDKGAALRLLKSPDRLPHALNGPRPTSAGPARKQRRAESDNAQGTLEKGIFLLLKFRELISIYNS